MRQFDFYEFAGVLVPGGVFLVGTSLFAEPMKTLIFDDLSAGEATLVVIVVYGLGHLVQALGNLIDFGWWYMWGGLPSDWVRSGRHKLLCNEQNAAIDSALGRNLCLSVSGGYRSMPAATWHAVVRQIYCAVANDGRMQRIDVFNGNYGLNRGLAAALGSTAIAALALQGLSAWRVLILLALGIALALYRMHRFGVHYARELFVQFLQLQSRDASNLRKD